MKPRFTYWRGRWWLAVWCFGAWQTVGTGNTPRAAWNDAGQWVTRLFGSAYEAL